MRSSDHPPDKKAAFPTVGAALLKHCLAAGGGILLLAGCASEAPVPTGSHVVVSTPKAEFFRNGPAEQFNFVNPTFDQTLMQQQAGPDFELPKGTHLTLLKHEMGFSRVVTEDGIVGYVANDEVTSAPAMARVTRLAAANPAERPTPYERRPRNNPQPRKIVEPALDLNDVPLPLP